MSRVDVFEVQASLASGLQSLRPSAGRDAACLHGIDIGYTDRDHFVRNISAGARVSAGGSLAGYEMVLIGRGGGQPGAAILKLADFTTWNVPLERVVVLGCRGINFRIPMRRFSRDEIFVLSGFSFDFGPGNDHQIQRIGVRPNPYQGNIDVSFGHHSATGPYRAAVSWLALPWRHFGRDAPSEPGYRHPLKTFRDDSFTGSTSGRRQHSNRLGLLHGFTLNFQNGVQNFQKLAIDLAGENVSVSYRGNTPGQPASALVEYVNWQLPIN